MEELKHGRIARERLINLAILSIVVVVYCKTTLLYIVLCKTFFLVCRILRVHRDLFTSHSG